MTLLGYWIGQEAWLVAVFNLVGLSVLAIAGVLGPDLRARPLPAWPFVVAVGVIDAGAVVVVVFHSSSSIRGVATTTIVAVAGRGLTSRDSIRSGAIARSRRLRNPHGRIQCLELSGGCERWHRS